MRSTAGSVTFVSALILSILFAAGACAGLAVLAFTPGLLKGLRGLASNPWWFHYASAAPADALSPVWRIGSAILAACIGSVAAFRALRLYRSGASPIVPFVIAFLLSLGMECLRGGTALLYAADRSIGAAIVVTRTIYWGRFVGLLGLLVAGLFCIELKYRKIMVLIGGLFLVAFAMVVYIPFDRTVFLAQLTWKLGDEQGVWFVNLVIGLLVIAASLAASFTRHDRRFLWLTTAFALFLLAREILFFALHPVILAAGLAALAGGAFLMLRTLTVIGRQSGEPAGL
jgi:hypothetical protein